MNMFFNHYFAIQVTKFFVWEIGIEDSLYSHSMML